MEYVQSCPSKVKVNLRKFDREILEGILIHFMELRKYHVIEKFVDDNVGHRDSVLRNCFLKDDFVPI